MKRYLFIITLLFSATRSFAQQSEAIRLNQVGYYPGSEKLAIVVTENADADFFIITEEKKDTVFTGHLGNAKHSAFSSLVTRAAEFSSFKTKGIYRVLIPGIGYSYSFKIADHIYNKLNAAVIKGFYYQRSGMPIDKKYAGKWSRSEGHPDTVVLVHPSAASATRPALFKISTPGGWYDAGDYNKYIVNSGITMSNLLSAYEDFPAYTKSLKTDIPESANAVPDILDEAIYNLRWMLSMQDKDDGGVYHKCTNAIFDPMIMPDAAKTPRYVVQKSTAATLDFVAVTAQAARILKGFEKAYPHLSDSCIKAAFKAWQWALKNNALYYRQEEMNKNFQPAVTTGSYGDNNVNDEWLWAASEMFITTKDKNYLQVVKEKMNNNVGLPSWNNVAMLGYFSLVRFQNSIYSEDQHLVNSMKDTLVAMADRFIAHVPENAFSTVMGQSNRDFIWGSNSVAANQGLLLINAYKITGNKKYLAAAEGNLDYLLGRNATGYCFVTGFGTKPSMNPHHRLSVADGITDPVPGLLVGGPNPGRQDKCKYEYFEPETSYADISCAYASNEIAINWNAPIVYLVTAIESLHQ